VVYVIDIENLKNDYLNGVTYAELEEKYDISYSKLKSIIRREKWRRSNSDIKKGNKYAKGHKPHLPINNKNAVTTGAYESIFAEFYSEEEKELAKKTNASDEIEKLRHDIEVYTIREYRMLQRMEKLIKQNKDMTVQSIQRDKRTTFGIVEETTEGSNTIVEATDDKIQRFEEALTRVQQARVKAISTLYSILNNNTNKEDNLNKIDNYFSKLEEAMKNE